MIKDYPKGVIRVWDNGGKTVDRYTVVYQPYLLDGQRHYPYVGMSGAPFHPQGFGQHGEMDRMPFKGRDKSILFADLPADCQRLVKSDLSDS